MLKVLACVAAFAVVAASLYVSPLFKIDKLDLSKNQSCITKEKLKNYQITNQSVFVFKTNLLEQKLKADFSCAKEIRVKKIFPNKLQVEIQTFEPIAKIDASELAITRDGQVSSNVSQNLPTIFLPSDLSAKGLSTTEALVKEGQKITDPAVLFALDLTALLAKSDFAAQNIRFVENRDVAVYNTKGTIALFSTQKGAQKQVDSLQALLAKAKIDPDKIAKIDLRFDKPTIVNKQTPDGQR